jgi:hypothetical protein
MFNATLPNPQTLRLNKTVVVHFGCTIFLSAFLLFQVQMVLGKYLLPFFGGTPSVWNTCMLFFQMLLLLGYLYVHILSLQKNSVVQGRVHSFLLIVSAAVLLVHWMKWGSPITPGAEWKLQAGDNPVLKILGLLCITAGLPFFLLSTTSPLLQNWLSRISSGTTPYRFYALSNAGSLIGLLSYPFFFEWALTTRHQSKVWSAAYLVFIILTILIAWKLSRRIAAFRSVEAAPSLLAEEGKRPRASRYLLWIALSTCSSTMLLATTNLFCQDIAVIPLLWVWPLSIYLSSFILVFDSARWYKRKIFWPLYFIALGVGLKTSFASFAPNVPMQIAAYSLALFAVCMVCHGELARTRPSTQHLTFFYCLVAAGGALGGIFVVLIAPQIFQGFWEFQIALLGCGFLLIAGFFLEDPTGRSEEYLWLSAVAILSAFLAPQSQTLFPELASVRLISNEYYTGALAGGFLLVCGRWRAQKSVSARLNEGPRTPWMPVAALGFVGLFAIISYTHTQFGSGYLLFQERDFFGVKYVTDSLTEIDLMSGSIHHGAEFKDPLERHIPTLYYRRSSGIGLLLQNYPRGSSGKEPIRVGLIGLGAGTLAAYGEPGDYFRFYEIDPAVIRIASGAKPFFHFVQDSHANVQIVEGDARLSLEQEANRGEVQRFDVLAVDAFSGDAIPVHLLTREAVDVFLLHLRGPDSVLAYHISNRYLDLAPVVAGLAESRRLQCSAVSDGQSTWILLAQNPAMLQLPNLGEKSTSVHLARRPLVWTDDYSNLIQLFR